jgi:predicted amidohydrolase YtcJ
MADLATRVVDCSFIGAVREATRKRRITMKARLFLTLSVLLGLTMLLGPSATQSSGAAPVAATHNRHVLSFSPGVPGWRQVNVNGFGDPSAKVVSTLEVFDGQLYAGTANWETGAVIWRTDDCTTWTAVTEPGFGDAYTNTNPAIVDMIVFDGQLYAGVGWDGAPGQIWRSTDGAAWQAVNTDGFGDESNWAISNLVVFESVLYAGTANDNGAQIWRSDSGDSGSWTSVVTDGLGSADAVQVTSFAVFQDSLYAAIEPSEGGDAQVWRTANGTDWTPIVTGGFGDAANTSTGGFAQWNGLLYLGVRNDTTGGQIWRTGNGTYWTQAMGDGFGDINNGKIESLFALRGALYAVTNNGITGLEVWRSEDGVLWKQVSPDGMGERNNEATLWSVATVAWNNRLYLGTYNAADGGEVWLYLPTKVYLPLVMRNHHPSQAELIFYNGSVLTLEGDAWEAQAIAIRGDKILAVGGGEVLALQGPGTRLVDLGGQTLMPGFVDAHTHVFNDAGYMGLDLEGAQQLALENGITSLADMYTPPEFLEEMQTFAAEDKLVIRTSLYLIYNTACGDLVGDWYTAHAPTHAFGEKLRIGGVKIFSDGGVCGRFALSFDYPPEYGGGQGDLWLTQEALSQAIAQADAAGYQVVVHALGDRAVETTQNAFELVLDGQPNILRHRIEHSYVVRPELLPRYGQIGLVTAIFGYAPICEWGRGEGFAEIVGPERLSWLQPYRALLDANPGLHVTWHGDDPWVGPVSPILELHKDGVTLCQPPDWLAATALTVEEALPLMTREAAYAIFREEEVGSLKPGKLADLIILSDNPLAVDPNTIKDITLSMTMVGGQVVYCAPGQETVCPSR